MRPSRSSSGRTASRSAESPIRHGASGLREQSAPISRTSPASGRPTAQSPGMFRDPQVLRILHGQDGGNQRGVWRDQLDAAPLLCAVQLTNPLTDEPALQLTASVPTPTPSPAKKALWLRLKHYRFE